jgi:hypothetical protein
VGPEYYVCVCSFVNQDLLEPGCTVLLHNKVRRAHTDCISTYEKASSWWEAAPLPLLVLP